MSKAHAKKKIRRDGRHADTELLNRKARLGSALKSLNGLFGQSKSSSLSDALSGLTQRQLPLLHTKAQQYKGEFLLVFKQTLIAQFTQC